MRTVAAMAVALLAMASIACSDTNSSAPPPTTDGPRVLGGTVLCDSCPIVQIDVQGEGLEAVTGAELVRQVAPFTTLGADIALTRIADASGETLHHLVTFTDATPTGGYDLHLRTGGDPIVVPNALRVTKDWRPDGWTLGGPAGSGVIRVAVETSGQDQDGSYAVRVVPAGTTTGLVKALDTDGSLEWRVTPGAYTLSLRDVADNCALSDATPVAVTVTSGSVTTVRRAVTCTPWGYLAVTATATGEDVIGAVAMRCDLGACGSGTVDTAAATPFVLKVGAGERRLSLTLPANCQAAGGNPQPVTVASGDTARVALAIACVNNHGTVKITASTAGPNALPLSMRVQWYAATSTFCNECSEKAVPSNGSAAVSVPAGPTWFFFPTQGNLCVPTSPNPVLVDVQADGTHDVAFSIECQ